MNQANQHVCLTFLGAAALALSSAAVADERAPDKLEVIEVTATRWGQSLADVARSVAVIDRDEMLTMQPPSVPSALAFEPNITAAGGPRSSNQVVNIRGLEGNKILQTVDGARQNFESGHRPTYFLEPELLRTVEAVRGPISSLWGSGAIGGVVAQNTITADDLLRDGQSLGGFVKGRYNDNDGNTGTGTVVGRGDQGSWVASGYYRNDGDLKMGNGDTLAGSGFDDWGGLAKGDWQFDDQQSVNFNYRHADWDGSVPSNASAEETDSSNYRIHRNQTSDNLSAGYQLRGDSEWLDLHALAYGNWVDMDEKRVSDGRSDSTSLETLGITLTNLARLGDNRLLLGIDSYRDEFDAQRGGTARPLPPQATSTVWSAFALAEIPLTAQWSMEMGLRYDDFETEARNLDSSSGDNATSPSAALIWDAADWVRLSLRYDRAFRSPGSEELYSSGYHFCMGPGFCNTFLPNPDLQSEEAANTEFDARFAFAKVAGADMIHIDTAVFENRVDNFIEQIVVGPFFGPVMDAGYTTWQNVDRATLQGGEISAAYLRGGMSLKASYGLVRGEDDRTNEDLTNIPADTYKLDASYNFAALRLLAGARYIYADDQGRTDYPENTDGETYDSYGVTDLYLSWQPGGIAGLRLDLTVNNVGDEYYRQAWAQLYEPGREVILSALYQF